MLLCAPVEKKRYTDLDRIFVIPLFWESLGQPMAHNLSYDHSILFKVASIESCRILDYIRIIYFDQLSVGNFLSQTMSGRSDFCLDKSLVMYEM